MSTKEPVKNRYDFVYLFDVTDGNPNGDPDTGNLPRIDIETGHGLVTDVCLKRKVRNYVLLASEEREELRDGTHDIFVMENAILNDAIADAVKQVTEDKQTKNAQDRQKSQEIMCRRYYDIRTFGAVLTTGANAGQVRGAVQMTFSRSIDPITSSEHTITRMAATDAKEAKSNEAADDGGGNRTMGRKATIPYGLYFCHGFVTPAFAQKTGFTEDDLALFWEALHRMFDVDRSSSRGLMGPRGLYIFRHDSKLGNASAQELFDRIRVERQTDLPRSFADYRVTIDDSNMPEGVTLIREIDAK